MYIQMTISSYNYMYFKEKFSKNKDKIFPKNSYITRKK